jgi:hypothetical protein
MTQEESGSVKPPGTEFLFIASCDSQGYGGVFENAYTFGLLVNPLSSNGLVIWLKYLDFQASCHNMNFELKCINMLIKVLLRIL